MFRCRQLYAGLRPRSRLRAGHDGPAGPRVSPPCSLYSAYLIRVPSSVRVSRY